MNGKNSGVNAVEPEKERSKGRWNGIIAALTALNRDKSGVDGVGTE